MQILGNRVLVERAEEEKQEGFQTVEVQDSFSYRGKVVQTGDSVGTYSTSPIKEGDIVLFAKYSPHTLDVTHEGKNMKVLRAEDIIAIV